MKNGIEGAFQKLQESLRASSQPRPKEGYKTAKEIAKELGRNPDTIRHELRRAAEQKLISYEHLTVNGHKTAFYRL